MGVVPVRTDGASAGERAVTIRHYVAVLAVAFGLLTLGLTAATPTVAHARTHGRARAAAEPCPTTGTNFPGVYTFTLTAAPTTVEQRGEVRYTLSTFSGTGEGHARTLVCFDMTLPAGFTYVPGSTLGGVAGGDRLDGVNPSITTLPDGRQLLVWSGQSVYVPPGVEFSLSVAARVSASATPGTHTVDYTIRSNDNRFHRGLGGAAVVVTAQEVHLTLAKTPASVVFTPGGPPETYHLTVGNPGASPAANVRITDHLPPGLTFDSASPGCSHNPTAGTVTCDIASVPGHDAVTVDITLSAPAGATPGIHENSASLTEDGVLGLAEAHAEAIIAGPGVSIAKTADEVGIAGREMSWTLAVLNNDPRSASGATITDTLPHGLTFVKATSTTHGVVCHGTHNGSAFSCTLPDIAGHAELHITLVTKIAPDLISPSSSSPGERYPSIEVINRAALHFNGSTHLSDRAVAEITGEAELTASKTAKPNPVAAGGHVTFTLGVKNHGPSNANHAFVEDTLPHGVRFVADQSDHRCGLKTTVDGVAVPTETVVCRVSTLAPGHEATFKVVGHVDPHMTHATLVNFAVVGSAQDDPNEDAISRPVEEDVHPPIHRPGRPHRPTRPRPRPPSFTG